ncbi:HU family DNA-binding protein [Pseudomonas cremoricolorata]|uniref:HU family DNA-binding protein n=1 Tax=Pseudomonas cremoricolorata TaxID=157783 RepID=UPI000424D01B|nr:HU family DNA-binding protein [Pseudomonas cremoricolorata]
MRKPDLAAAIAEKTDLTKDMSNHVLNVILDSIASAVETQSVTLVGFGTFEKRHRGARTGKNPQTGEPVQIRATNTVAFKPGKLLKGTVGLPAQDTASASRAKGAAGKTGKSAK